MSDRKHCLYHPDRKALSFCHNCGNWFCAECLVEGPNYYYCMAGPCQNACEKERAALAPAAPEAAEIEPDEIVDDSPFAPERKAWVDKSFQWLIRKFGTRTVRSVPVVVPTPEFFPDEYDGSDEAVEKLIHRVCGYMRVDPARFEVMLFESQDPLAGLVPVYQGAREGPAGLFQQAEGSDKMILSLDLAFVDTPEVLVAVAAHELAHVHLIGDKLLTGTEDDHEPLADLLTVFFGLGVFTANAAFQFSQRQAYRQFIWRAGMLGYLSEQTLGYALAVFAWLREDREAEWSKYLDENVDHYRKECAKYLSDTDGAGLPVIGGL